MTEKTASAVELHADHLHWKSELAMWQEDIVNWRSEHAIATELLIQAKAMIVAHETGLSVHEEKLREVRNAVDYHERELSESLRGGSDPNLGDALVGRHDEELHTMENQRSAHERIKRHHHKVMAKVEILLKSLEAPM